MPHDDGKSIPLLLIAVISSIGQFATNIQLPSFVAIAVEFHVAEYVPPLTLSVYLVAFAVSQLFLGTASDRLGRKPVLCWSLVIFIAGTLIAACAPSVAVLFLGRCVQGLGAGGAMVVGRAIIRDHTTGDRFVRAIALVTALGALFPSMAPLVGGLVQEMAGWRWSLAFIGAIAVAALILLLARLPRQHGNLQDRTLSPKEMLRSGEFLAWTVGSGAAMGAMFAFFSGSPSILVGRLGMSPAEFGLYPPIVASFYALGAMGVRTFSSRDRGRVLGAAAATLMIGGSAIILVPMLYGILDKWVILAGAALFTCGLGG